MMEPIARANRKRNTQSLLRTPREVKKKLTEPVRTPREKKKKYTDPIEDPVRKEKNDKNIKKGTR